MSNENVEYNKIQCNELLLGNEKTGYISLRSNVNEEADPSLVLSQGGDEGGDIIIGFKQGRPTLALFNESEKKGSIEIGFNDEGAPILRFFSGRDSTDIVTLGFNNSGSPSLYLSNSTENGETFINLSAEDDGSLYLTLSSQGETGGKIFLNTDSAGAGIMLSSEDRMESEKERWGIFMITDQERSALDAEGNNHFNVMRMSKKAGSEV